MRQLLNVDQALKLFFELEENAEPDSELESDECDDEVDDPLFFLEEKQGRRDTPTRSRSPLPQAAEPHLSSEPWKSEGDADITPGCSRFQPLRTPGVQIETFSPKAQKIFSYCFLLLTHAICANTNKNLGKKYKWTDVETEHLYQFFGLLIYMSLVSLPSLRDYWRQNHILSVPLPSKVMTRDRFRSIFWNIYLSDPEEDLKNDAKKGTPGHDKLFRIRPLSDETLSACQAYYHPRRESSVDERMVATKAKTGMTQYMKDKPTKWGMKMFILAESRSGYTISFTIYTGKNQTASEHELAYDVVMNLIQPSCLGTGYHVYMDNFYTNPRLFLDLTSMRFGACGTYRENRKGCPKDRANALNRKCPRGSVRWIREGPLVFVKWMDTREVSVCSTIHPAFSGETVKRKVKDKDGHWATREIPCPTPIMAYNKNMGGVDLSDQLIQYYSTHRKTACWYRTMLLHFLDIATTNAFIMHREMCSAKQVQPMAQKDFMVELVCQLCGMDKTGKATKGRLKCKCCLQENNRTSDTPWKCQACGVPPGLVVDRNCFLEWHK
ncbi:squamous cell carcinoma antigen recognized by T-cells 3 [Sarotherodon galilaeus]